MFTLYMRWEAQRILAPDNIQFILTPREALEMASIFYELDYLDYDYQCNLLHRNSVPKRRQGVHHRHAAQPYRRKQRSEYDGLYDEVKWNLEHGWMVGVDTGEKWDKFRNPFSFDGEGNLVYDCFMDTYGESFPQVVRQIYEYALNEHQGRKPPPTVKEHYFDAPIQHAQATKTINSKAAGRLLAAGGIYNGNIEGFHKTAQQLGADAPAGYDQVMGNKGLIIAGASVAAGLGLVRLGAAGEINDLHVLGKVEGEYSMIKPGPLPKELAETFSSGTYKEISLSTDTRFYRGGVEGRPLGQFFGYEQPLGVLQTRVDKALLPKWPNGSESPLDSYHEIQIPAGTKVYVGKVGYQTDLYSGGTEQVIVPTPWKIPGIKILGRGGLK
ncbi:hypothetical protein L8T08_00570 [Enterobacter bugandensis]|uniref:hypothetical protein n=1 Tax=Enterobacter bugandensis TaxID=881260 RepID=UPI002004B741|nr:hypothetical protein [Enterobacter bugandensis]MCK6750092.1 hypothetical protein [Enterobacter bugandensis]MCK6763371.1 hypothetical protein [Enterobacter bugandensis]HED6263590.1 hypothetical protein [Enterobacter bugandensis]